MHVKVTSDDATAVSDECFVAAALEAHDNDVKLDEHSVQLYSPVTSSTVPAAQTSPNKCYLSTFQQFCKVCNNL